MSRGNKLFSIKQIIFYELKVGWHLEASSKSEIILLTNYRKARKKGRVKKKDTEK